MFYSNFWIKIENHSEHLLAIFVMENYPSCWSFKSNALSSFCCILTALVSSDYGSVLQWIKTDKFYVMLCKERVGNSPVHFESSSPTRYQKIWYCTRTTTWKCNCEAHEEDKKQGLRGTDMPSEVKNTLKVTTVWVTAKPNKHDKVWVQYESCERQSQRFRTSPSSWMAMSNCHFSLQTSSAPECGL
jgi:hypothetical protein